MSRLPRPHSSPDSKAFAPSLKRKLVPEENDDIEEHPSKKPNAGGFRPKPLQASTNATKSTSTSTNAKSTAAVMPRPLTRPRPPAAARPTSRGASAPPVSTVRKPSAGLGVGSRPPAVGKRVASGSGSVPATATAAAPDVITNLHKRLATLESARNQDTERLATLFESAATAAAVASSSTAAAPAAAESLVQLQTELLAVQTHLASTTAQLNAANAQLQQTQGLLSHAQTSEGDLRRELHALKAELLTGKTAVAVARDDADTLRRALAMEKEEGDIRLRRAERELREMKEEVEEREERARTLKRELEGAMREEGGMRERCRTVEGRLAYAEEAWDRDKNAFDKEREKWASEREALEREREALEAEKEEMRKEAVRGEEERRRLHGLVMELKGNIRVFCRVRPVLPSEKEQGEEREREGEKREEGAAQTAAAEIAYPDAGVPYPSGQKEIVLSSAGAEREWDAGMGVSKGARREVWGFGFDRVFPPSSTQADLFAEIAQLAQSCIDGYNVCIFAYGQTGSGKSWTMEGGGTEETQGMIPRAMAQVFRVAEELKDKGWTYTMEGQFLEIYNETITDLLAPAPSASEPPRKHEIHHHPTTHLTTVSDVLTPALSSPAQVLSLLGQAQSRRRVAATGMNERSSRSHSVFTLRIRGVHESKVGAEGVRVGTLNLVDLAGSERLATLTHGGERLKETQNINRSLSALGDVVAALGSGPGAHVPYRNSKLTYLLQNSLSGNSKTLMVLNLSPLAAHLNESLTSLRFATKVNNTTIGTAKKVPVQTGNVKS
ncbi:kinesin-domain-containing protein [Mycena sanguinolenta]|nr:kinesin-domain-containing protein [Mycena sanguinolenta]